jgi:hypothetical protein
MTFVAELQKAGQIAKWDRLAAKRQRKSSFVLRWIVGALSLLIIVGSVTMASVAPLFTLSSSLDREGFLLFVSLLAGAFLLYIQMMILYNSLFLSDSDLLLTAPLTGRTVLLVKVMSLFRFSIVSSAMGLPLVGVYGYLLKAPWYYYPAAVLAIAVAAMFVVSIGLLLMMLLMLLLKRRISRDALAVFSSIIAILILLGPRLLVAGQVTEHTGWILWTNPWWLTIPFVWFGKAIVELAAGSWQGVVYMLAMGVVFGLAMWASLTIAQNALHERFSRMAFSQEQTGKRLRRSPRAARQVQRERGAGTLTRVLPAPAYAILKKDLQRIKRSAGDLSNYLFPTGYLIYFMIQPHHSMGSSITLIPLFILILSSTMGRVPISSFGIERENIWLLVQSPISAHSIIIGKWLYGSIPTMVWWGLLAILMSVFVHVPYAAVIILLVTGIWMIPGAVMLTMPFAINGAAFKIRRIRQRVTYINRGANWYILLVFPYLILQFLPIGFACLPYYQGLPAGFSTFMVTSPLLHVVIGIAFSLVLAVLAIWLGWSMSREAWRSRFTLILETGELE